MSRTGKRVVLVKPQRPVEVWDKPIGPPSATDVILRTHLAGICGTDIHLWRGEVPLPGPVVLGHEGVGTVEELGSLVHTDHAGTPLRHGDRVYWLAVRP